MLQCIHLRRCRSSYSLPLSVLNSLICYPQSRRCVFHALFHLRCMQFRRWNPLTLADCQKIPVSISVALVSLIRGKVYRSRPPTSALRRQLQQPKQSCMGPRTHAPAAQRMAFKWSVNLYPWTCHHAPQARCTLLPILLFRAPLLAGLHMRGTVWHREAL